jgi:hypothetical protein
MLAGLADARHDGVNHRILKDGHPFDGTWEEIVAKMRDAGAWSGRPIQEFMMNEARRGFSLTGVVIPTGDAESFIRGSADAGLLRILK